MRHFGCPPARPFFSHTQHRRLFGHRPATLEWALDFGGKNLQEAMYIGHFFHILCVGIADFPPPFWGFFCAGRA